MTARQTSDPSMVARRIAGSEPATSEAEKMPARSPFGQSETGGQTANLASVLAGIRKTESGSFQGSYGQKQSYGGRATFGAYNLFREYWDDWATLAGLPGAPIESAQAQNIVAAYMMQTYYERYGDWDLAAVAFYAGPEQANIMIRRGWTGVDSIQNPKIKEYVNNVRANTAEAVRTPDAAYLQRIPISNLSFSGGNQWVMPVAGTSEWSRGSWMPNTKNHRGRTHGAIDIYATKGTPIVSPVAGKVISVKEGELGGYTARIEGNDGVVYYFAHMAEQAVVNVGDSVLPGYHIGYVGNSGSAKNTSPHLHFSMKRGSELVSPISFLEQGSVATQHGGPSYVPTADDATVRASYAQTPNDSATWLQGLSSAVANGVPVMPEEPEEPEESELGDKRVQAESASATREQRMV